AQEFLMPRQFVMAGPVGLDQRDDLALAQRPALMRAAVGQREILAVQIEPADLAAVHVDDLALARRDLDRAGDDLTLHGRPYNALALSRKTLAFCASVMANLKVCCGSSKSQCG